MSSTIAGPTTVVSVVEIKNISRQTIALSIKKYLPSKVYNPQGGVQNIGAGVTLVVEDNRVDLRQLIKLSNLKLLKYEQYKKKIAASTGSTGAGSGSA